MNHSLSLLPRLVLAVVALVGLAAPASALTLTDRNVDLQGKLDIKSASKIADKLLKLDAVSDAPIFLIIGATDGTAQGVMIVADTVRTLASPVVGVVMTEIHGAGAALAPFTDRVVVFPSAGLIFTELDYEGVKKPPEPEEAEAEDKAKDKGESEDGAGKGDAKAAAPKAKKKEPSKRMLLLHKARAAFLDRFYGRLAKRMFMKKAELLAAIDEGGLLMSAQEAVSKRVAHAVVDKLVYVKLPVEKSEVKVTTTDKKVEVAPKSALDRDGDG